MDEHYRNLERKFHVDRDYETACKLIHLDWMLGVYNLREQADKYNINYEDIWDCANRYSLGYTQNLVDATNLALAQENIQAENQESFLYTNRSSSDTLLREAITLAKANSYYCRWDINIRNVEIRRASGPDEKISLSLSDDPMYYSLPSLKITGVPHGTGTTHTATIYIADLKEIPRIIHVLHLIALIIHGIYPYPERWEELVGYAPRFLDEIENTLRELGILYE